jgi:DNA polymerase III subunit gamma/tau
MAWDIRYRPLRFTDVIGQEGVIALLKARVTRREALDTSYVFAGPHGTGKTTLARILARAMLCHDIQPGPEPCNQCENCRDILDEVSPAFQELDAASRGSIDNVREIVDELGFAIPGAAKRIVLFDEMHRMSPGAQDALLKPIEDKRMVAILCTTEEKKIRSTIRSRCDSHAFRKITSEEIFKRMAFILGEEKVEYDPNAVQIVIDYSGGHVRDVVKRLEMVSGLGPITVESVREYLNLGEISAFYETLLALDNPTKLVELLEGLCSQVAPEEVAAGLAEAAMNTYRLKHQMLVDFVFADRDKAQKVYEKFGDSIVSLARFFLGVRAQSKVALFCDILSLAESGGVSQEPASLTPKIVLQASVPTSNTVKPSDVKTGGGVEIPGGPQTSVENTYREHKVMPRGAGKDIGPVEVVRPDSVDLPLAPTEWARAFERAWRENPKTA